VLVATDVAARGVHVDNVELVIHVDPPMEHKAYLHRSGRTARAGSEGDVVTISLPSQKQDLKTLLRKAAITVTPQRVTSTSTAVTTLVGDVAPYVKPQPRAAVQQQQGGGGRSQGANAQRKRAARSGEGRGQSDVGTSAPRRDRSGRTAEAKAQAPKQGGGHSRGAQTTGAQRGTSARSGSAKQPMRVGSLVSPSRSTRGNRRAQG
jgi:superfamily II DNA/RNA helicase